MKKYLWKNKLAFLAMICLFVMGTTVETFGLRMTDAEFKNVFNVSVYESEFYEKFESPSNWQPGQATEKEFFVKNINQEDIIVRVKLTEVWVSASGAILSGEIEVDESMQRVAILKFNNPDDWVLDEDGYYYYQKILKPGETTSAFLGSVEFNPNVKMESEGVDAAGKRYGDENHDPLAWDADGGYIGFRNEEGYWVKRFAPLSTSYNGAKCSLNVKGEILQALADAMISQWNYDISKTSGGAYSLYQKLIATT